MAAGPSENFVLCSQARYLQNAADPVIDGSTTKPAGATGILVAVLIPSNNTSYAVRTHNIGGVTIPLLNTQYYLNGDGHQSAIYYLNDLSGIANDTITLDPYPSLKGQAYQVIWVAGSEAGDFHYRNPSVFAGAYGVSPTNDFTTTLDVGGNFLQLLMHFDDTSGPTMSANKPEQYYDDHVVAELNTSYYNFRNYYMRMRAWAGTGSASDVINWYSHTNATSENMFYVTGGAAGGATSGAGGLLAMDVI